jgi:release factor glutamine methyltransferase
MSADQWTIRRLLDWTEKFLCEKEIENPRLDAQILLAHTLGCKRIDLYVRSDDEPTESQRNAFKALIRKRVEGCPVAYLVGRREFYQLDFKVSPDVLIPRPETEFLVMEALRRLKGMESPRVVDIGTGTGCIALSIARHHSTARLTATDISAPALAVARRNAEQLGVADRVRLLEGDLFAPLAAETFDLIVSNPPYIAAEEFAGLAREVREYEPRIALEGGADGLDIYRRLIAEAPNYLRSGGYLLLEIGATQERAVRELIERCRAFSGVATHLDGQKLPRIIEARLSDNKSG